MSAPKKEARGETTEATLCVSRGFLVTTEARPFTADAFELGYWSPVRLVAYYEAERDREAAERLDSICWDHPPVQRAARTLRELESLPYHARSCDGGLGIREAKKSARDVLMDARADATLRTLVLGVLTLKFGVR